MCGKDSRKLLTTAELKSDDTLTQVQNISHRSCVRAKTSYHSRSSCARFKFELSALFCFERQPVCKKAVPAVYIQLWDEVLYRLGYNQNNQGQGKYYQWNEADNEKGKWEVVKKTTFQFFSALKVCVILWVIKSKAFGYHPAKRGMKLTVSRHVRGWRLSCKKKKKLRARIEPWVIVQLWKPKGLEAFEYHDSFLDNLPLCQYINNNC